MALPLLDVRVWQNWQAITRDMAHRRNHLWRVVQVAVVASTLLMLLGLVFLPDWPGHSALRSVLFTGVLWLLPLWAIHRWAGYSAMATALRLLAAAALLAVAVTIGYATIPLEAEPNPWLSCLPIVIVPAFTWSLLFLMHRRYPVPLRLLGFSFQHWPANVVIGAAAGLALGLHLLLIAAYLPQLRSLLLPSLPLLFWAVFFRVGLSALGEELFFRGLGYHLLYDGTPRGLLIAIGKLTVLNLPVYFVPLLAVQTVTVAGALLVLAYGAICALLATFLRHRQDSLLPGLVCNVVFSLFLILLLEP